MAPRGESKKLPPEQAEHLAAIVRQVVAERYGGVASKAAKPSGVTQSQLSRILRGDGAGVAVLCRLREWLDISLDDLLGLPPLRRRSTVDDRLREMVEEALSRVTSAPPVTGPPVTPPPAPRPASRRR